MSDLFQRINEANFGNTTGGVAPAETPGAIAPEGYGEPESVVKFPSATNDWPTPNTKHSSDPSIITASIQAAPDGVPTAGPLTGIALWGSGGSQIQIAEFDIPITTNPIFTLDDTRFLPFGGTLISVPGTSLEVRARNDANLIPPPSNGGNILSGPIGNGGDATTALANVTASICAGTKDSFARATKTVWGFFDDAADILGRGLQPNDSVTMLIPPFATAVRVARSAGTPPTPAPTVTVEIGMRNLTHSVDGPYTFATGVICDELILTGQAGLITVTNTSAVRIAAVLAIFTLAI